jgi:hypothetical protein
MEKQFNKFSGISLIIGSVLLVATMVLHPSGGSIEHILNIKWIIIVSHSLAIFSLPFIAFGFWGLSSALATDSRMSILSFIIACFGLVAAMVAASINGLVLPMFLSHVSAEGMDEKFIRLVTTYGHFINASMDFVLIAALALSIFLWSILIIRTGKFPKWIGYYGVLLMVAVTVAALANFNLIGLFGFRMVVFGVVGWIVSVGIKMTIGDKVRTKS